MTLILLTAAVGICGCAWPTSCGAVDALRCAVDRSDLGALATLLAYAAGAGFFLLVAAYTAGVMAGLAVQGFELVR